MIHSLSGGVMHDIDYYDFAKVEIQNMGNYWYISEIADLKENEYVLVPYGKNEKLVRAKVIRIDKKISSQMAPFPINRTKRIFSRV